MSVYFLVLLFILLSNIISKNLNNMFAQKTRVMPQHSAIAA